MVTGGQQAAATGNKGVTTTAPTLGGGYRGRATAVNHQVPSMPAEDITKTSPSLAAQKTNSAGKTKEDLSQLSSSCKNVGNVCRQEGYSDIAALYDAAGADFNAAAKALENGDAAESTRLYQSGREKLAAAIAKTKDEASLAQALQVKAQQDYARILKENNESEGLFGFLKAAGSLAVML